MFGRGTKGALDSIGFDKMNGRPPETKRVEERGHGPIQEVNPTSSTGRVSTGWHAGARRDPTLFLVLPAQAEGARKT